MKRIIIALLVITSLSAVSQESVLLRVNYTKGDQYLLKIEQIQDAGLQGGMSMKMEMDMVVSEADGKVFKSESKIKSIVMDMMQGGQTMSFDSNKKAEDLDEIGQGMKAQFDPMMEAVIYTTTDYLGKNVETKVIPTVPGADQLSQSSNVNYPKEKVSVGSTWNSEDENQGMKMKTTYRVSKISNGTVFLDITGAVTGLGEGTIKGSAEIDVKTGVQKKSIVEVFISGGGVEAKVTSKISMTKI